MSGSASSGQPSVARWLLAGAVWLLTLHPAPAEVTSTLVTRTYPVPGTTARDVVRYMQSHPIRGDHGSAFANIRPSYSLSIRSSQKGGICRTDDVDVRIRFVLTVPEATHRSRMSKRVRGAWDAFASFVRRHEEHHRQSYIGCAQRFVAATRKQSGASCVAVESAIRTLFAAMKRECEAKQVAWDRGQKGQLRRQTLVRMAGY